MPEQPQGHERLGFTREGQIDLPSPDSEKLMAIRRSDWEKLQRRISRLANPPPRLSIGYSIAFGIAASTGATIYPMALSQGLPAWVTPTYVLTCIFALALGCILVWLDRKNRAYKQSELSDVMQDMKDIEDSFKREAGNQKGVGS